MSYQVLARSYRPQDFESVIGQDSTIQTLHNAFTQQKLHHAYLLTGSRGVGKTTIARILAKCFNCESGITATPCNHCEHCTAISQGRHLDLIEVDAASRTKVEETRALLENIQFAPHSGRHKIYLIDEVHMLSKHSFNALLKTIEEPPAHVKFIFATTDPQKIPATIISRCLQFHLRLIDSTVLEQHLADILKKEAIPAEEAAISIISQAAEGSVRDALSLLDQAIAHGNGSLTAKQVQTMLGLTNTNQIGALLQALQQQDCLNLLQVGRELIARGAHSKQLLDQLLCDLHKLSIASSLKAHGLDRETIIQATARHIEHWMHWFSPQQIQVFYQTVLIGKRDLDLAPSPAIGLEMVLLRMLAFVRHQPLAASPTTTGDSAFKTQATATDRTIPQDSNAERATAVQKPTPKGAPNTHPTADTTDKTQPIRISKENWDTALIDALSLTGAARALAQQCSLVSYTLQHLILQLDPQHKILLQKNYQKRIEEAVSKYYQTPVKVTIDLADKKEKTQKSPQRQQQQAVQDNQSQQLKKAQDNPEIQKIIKKFDAQIIQESLQTTPD